jgi:methionyl aminopeptidase
MVLIKTNLIKTKSELEKIIQAGKILRATHSLLQSKIAPGITPLELDKLAHDFIVKSKATPGFLNYKSENGSVAYPNTICASNNEFIVHTPPNNTPLQSGDVFSLDIGVKYKGYNADAAVTIGVGKISDKAKELIQVTKKALELGIAAAKPGNTLGDIGYAIDSYVQSKKMHIVKGLTGHGIGKKLHEPPVILNEGQKGYGMKIKPGMVFAIEPMVSLGTKILLQTSNGSFKTSDNSLSAHFEHTIIITKNKPKIVT